MIHLKKSKMLNILICADPHHTKDSKSQTLFKNQDSCQTVKDLIYHHQEPLCGTN
jgi:hypothetical protein